MEARKFLCSVIGSIEFVSQSFLLNPFIEACIYNSDFAAAFPSPKCISPRRFVIVVIVTASLSRFYHAFPDI